MQNMKTHEIYKNLINELANKNPKYIIIIIINILNVNTCNIYLENIDISKKNITSISNPLFFF